MTIDDVDADARRGAGDRREAVERVIRLHRQGHLDDARAHVNPGARRDAIRHIDGLEAGGPHHEGEALVRARGADGERDLGITNGDLAGHGAPAAAQAELGGRAPREIERGDHRPEGPVVEGQLDRRIGREIEDAIRVGLDVLLVERAPRAVEARRHHLDGAHDRRDAQVLFLVDRPHAQVVLARGLVLRAEGDHLRGDLLSHGEVVEAGIARDLEAIAERVGDGLPGHVDQALSVGRQDHALRAPRLPLRRGRERARRRGRRLADEARPEIFGHGYRLAGRGDGRFSIEHRHRGPLALALHHRVARRGVHPPAALHADVDGLLPAQRGDARAQLALLHLDQRRRRLRHPGARRRPVNHHQGIFREEDPRVIDELDVGPTLLEAVDTRVAVKGHPRGRRRPRPARGARAHIGVHRAELGVGDRRHLLREHQGLALGQGLSTAAIHPVVAEHQPGVHR